MRDSIQCSVEAVIGGYDNRQRKVITVQCVSLFVNLASSRTDLIDASIYSPASVTQLHRS